MPARNRPRRRRAPALPRCRWCREELQRRRGPAQRAPSRAASGPHSADSLHHHGPELDERLHRRRHCLCSALHPTAPGNGLAADARRTCRSAPGGCQCAARARTLRSATPPRRCPVALGDQRGSRRTSRCCTVTARAANTDEPKPRDRPPSPPEWTSAARGVGPHCARPRGDAPRTRWTRPRSPRTAKRRRCG